MRGKLLGTAATLAAAGALAGCGSSHNAASVSRAADVTARVPGYRIAATMVVSSPPAGTLQITMNGVTDRAQQRGSVDAQETVAGRPLRFTEVFSGLSFYLRSVGNSTLAQLTGGKHWLKVDMSRTLGAVGLSSLPTGTDPSQFVDFLRAVSPSTKRIGTETVRGVLTTHYQATVDLNRYPNLVAKSQRAAAARSVATLKSAIGGHTVPMDAFIDHQNLVRRLDIAFPECVGKQRLRLTMRIDLYDYGPQAAPRIPPARDVYDLTPILSKTLSKVHVGCTAS